MKLECKETFVFYLQTTVWKYVTVKCLCWSRLLKCISILTFFSARIIPSNSIVKEVNVFQLHVILVQHKPSHWVTLIQSLKSHLIDYNNDNGASILVCLSLLWYIIYRLNWDWSELQLTRVIIVRGSQYLLIWSGESYWGTLSIGYPN